MLTCTAVQLYSTVKLPGTRQTNIYILSQVILAHKVPSQIFITLGQPFAENLGEVWIARLCCMGCRGYVALFTKTKSTPNFGLGLEYENNEMPIMF